MHEHPREHDGFSEDPRLAAQEVYLALRVFVAELLQRSHQEAFAPKLTDAEVAAVIRAEDKFAMFYDSPRYIPSEQMVDTALSGEEFEVEFPDEEDPPTLVRFPR